MWWIVGLGSALAADPCVLAPKSALPREVKDLVRKARKSGSRPAADRWWTEHPDAPAGIRLRVALAHARTGPFPDVEDALRAWGPDTIDAEWCRAGWARELVGEEASMAWLARARAGDPEGARATRAEARLVDWVQRQPESDRFEAADRLLGQHPLTVDLATPLGRSDTPPLRALWRLALHDASADTPLLDAAQWERAMAARPGRDTPALWAPPIEEATFWTQWGTSLEAEGDARLDGLFDATRDEWRRSGVTGRAATFMVATLASAVWQDDCGVRPEGMPKRTVAWWHERLGAHLREIEQTAEALVSDGLPEEGRRALTAAQIRTWSQCAYLMRGDAGPLPGAVSEQLTGWVRTLPTGSIGPDALSDATVRAVANSFMGLSPATAGQVGRWVAQQGHASKVFDVAPWGPGAEAAASAFVTQFSSALASMDPADQVEAIRRWLPAVRSPEGRVGRLVLLDAMAQAGAIEMPPEAVERALVATDGRRADAALLLVDVFRTAPSDTIFAGLDLVHYESLAQPDAVLVAMAPLAKEQWETLDGVVEWAIDGWRRASASTQRRQAREALVKAVTDNVVATFAEGDVGELGEGVDRLVDTVPRIADAPDRALIAAVEALIAARAARTDRATAVLEMEAAVSPGSPVWCHIATESLRYKRSSESGVRWVEHGPVCGASAEGRTGAEVTEENEAAILARLEAALKEVDKRDVAQLRTAFGRAAAIDGGEALGRGQLGVADALLQWSMAHLEAEDRMSAVRLRAVGLGRQGRWQEARSALPVAAQWSRAEVDLQRAVAEMRLGRLRDAGDAFLRLLREDTVVDAAAVNLAIVAERLGVTDTYQSVRWLDRGMARLPEGARKSLLDLQRYRLVGEGPMPVAVTEGASAPVLNAIARLLGELGQVQAGVDAVDQALASNADPRATALLVHTRAEVAFRAGDLETAQRMAASAWERAIAVGDDEVELWAASLQADLAASRGDLASAVLYGKLALRSLRRSPYALDCGTCSRVDSVPVVAESVTDNLVRRLLAAGRVSEAQAMIEHQARTPFGAGWPDPELTRLEALAADLLYNIDASALPELERAMASEPLVAPDLPPGVARLAIHADDGGGTMHLWVAGVYRTLELAPDTAAMLGTFRRAASDPSRDPLESAARAYDRMIRPFEEVLSGATTLQVVGTGAAAGVPWGALYDGRAWLAEQYVMWGWSTQSLAPRTPFGASRREVVGFAASAGTRRLSPLPGARSEVEDVADRAFVDADFTRTSLRTALWRRPQVVHVASHFVLEPPEGVPYLLLGDGSTMPVSDLSTLRFQGVDLVVLSACDTASTRGANRLGSVAAMFQRQGAQSVIGTLWPVADRTTAVAMAELHDALREGLDAGAALQRAQHELWRGHPVLAPETRGLESIGTAPRPATLRGTRHPYYWAGFVVH